MAKRTPERETRRKPPHPDARIYVDGVECRLSRPLTRGWELVSTGAEPRYFPLTHAEYEDTERVTVVYRSYAGNDSPFPKIVRREIFIKGQWLQRLDEHVEKGGARSDAALKAFAEKNLPDVRKALEAWHKAANYDHGASKRRSSSKPRFLSTNPDEAPELLPSWRHLRRMYAKYVQEKKNILGQRNRTENMNAGGSRVSEVVQEIIEAVAAEIAGEAGRSIQTVTTKARARVVKYNEGLPEHLHEQPPCWKTVANEVSRLPFGMKYGGRKGLARLRMKVGPFGEGRHYRRVGERGEQDCWNIPLFLQLKKAGVLSEIPGNIIAELTEKAERINVSVLVDKASGYVCGMAWGLAESAELTTSVLYMALRDKTQIAKHAGCRKGWSGPIGWDEIATDGGPGFYADLYQTTAIHMGGHTFAAAGLPHLRGLIESVFSTIHKGFIADQVARAFENIVAKGEYEPEKRAVLTLAQFLQIMIRYIVDVYHNTPRDHGLRASPQSEFDGWALENDVKEAPSEEELRVWFGFPIDRQLGSHGVQFMHIRYDSPWLINHRINNDVHQVEVRVNLEDLGAISVLIDDQWLTVPARDSAFRGVSLEDWKQILQDLRRRFSAEYAIDFRTYVGPALLDIEKVNRDAERAMKLVDVVWDKERLEKAEESLRIRVVYDDDPKKYARAPALGDGSIGRSFARPAQRPTLTTSSSEPTSPPASDEIPPTTHTPRRASAPRTQRRRLTFKE